MAERVRIGIIGSGGMGHAHANAYSGDARARIVAVADTDKARARALGEKAGAKAYSDLARMLGKERLDAASVCTPPAGHLQATLAALDAGCHVLCEKPMALNAAQAERMVKRAAARRRLLIAAFCHRFHEPNLVAKRLIGEGRIGKVLQFRNRFAGMIPMEGKWFSDPKVAGGGAIIDTSIHSIDLFRYLVGDAVSVSARLATMIQPIKVEDSSMLLLQTADGAIGSIEACWSSPVSGAMIEIYGSQGTLIVDYETGLRYRTTAMKAWRRPKLTGPDRFTAQARHFLDCVLGERDPIVTGRDGWMAARIADAAYASAKQRVWVPV
jgi:predicted dehydrogenase